MGQLIAAGVLRGCQTIDSDWAWRIPVSIQWVWAPFIFVGAFLAPESPWWLIRKGRYDDARISLEKLTSSSAGIPYDSRGAVSMIKHTNELEKAMSAGVGYTDCFTGPDARRTLIACIVWLTQALCGAAMMR
jgi:MFS transporter, SP family, general alpha glucoside:H+ symporter